MLPCRRASTRSRPPPPPPPADPHPAQIGLAVGRARRRRRRRRGVALPLVCAAGKTGRKCDDRDRQARVERDPRFIDVSSVAVRIAEPEDQFPLVRETPASAGSPSGCRSSRRSLSRCRWRLVRGPGAVAGEAALSAASAAAVVWKTHVVLVPSGFLTSRWSIEWGLMNSIFLRVPVISTGLSMSYCAAIA